MLLLKSISIKKLNFKILKLIHHYEPKSSDFWFAILKCMDQRTSNLITRTKIVSKIIYLIKIGVCIKNLKCMDQRTSNLITRTKILSKMIYLIKIGVCIKNFKVDVYLMSRGHAQKIILLIIRHYY